MVWPFVAAWIKDSVLDFYQSIRFILKKVLGSDVYTLFLLLGCSYSRWTAPIYTSGTSKPLKSLPEHQNIILSFSKHLFFCLVREERQPEGSLLRPLLLIFNKVLFMGIYDGKIISSRTYFTFPSAFASQPTVRGATAWHRDEHVTLVNLPPDDSVQCNGSLWPHFFWAMRSRALEGWKVWCSLKNRPNFWRGNGLIAPIAG